MSLFEINIYPAIFSSAFRRWHTAQKFINSKSDNPIDFYNICFFPSFPISFPPCDLTSPEMLLLLLYEFIRRKYLVPRWTGKKVINNLQLDSTLFGNFTYFFLNQMKKHEKLMLFITKKLFVFAIKSFHHIWKVQDFNCFSVCFFQYQATAKGWSHKIKPFETTSRAIERWTGPFSVTFAIWTEYFK